MNDTPVNRGQDIELARELGLIAPNKANRDLLDFQGTESTFLSKGFNSFDKGILPESDVNEQRAQLQSGWDHTKAGVGRLAGRAISEILKMPGSFGGMLGYAGAEGVNALMGEGFGQENFGEYVNNALNRFIEESVAENINEALPVYTREAIANGTLWDNITSSSFWANEGADGVGFLLSFLVPGAAMKGAGLVGGGANNLGRIGNLARGAGLGVKSAKNLEVGSIATLNALFESAAEASSGYESVLEELKHKEAQRRQQWNGEGEYKGKTEEELKSVAGEAAASIFTANMGILMFPNFLQAKALFGSAKGSKISNKLMNQVVDPTGKVSTKAIAKLPVWQRAGGYLSAIGKNSFSEGFWEEGMQYSAEKYFSHVDEQGEKGFFNNVGGIFETYMKELGSLDMQKGIFLGTVLGSPFGIISQTQEDSLKQKRDKGLVNLLRKNYNSFTGNLDMFKTVVDSNGVETIDMSSGKPEIDQIKLAKIAKEMEEMDTLVSLKQASDLAGDTMGSNMLLKEIATRFGMGYMNASDPKALMEHANASFNLNNTPADERAVVTEQLRKLEGIYKSSKRFAESLKFKNDSKTTSIEAVRDRIVNLLTVLSSRESSATENVQELEMQLAGMTDTSTPDYQGTKAQLKVYETIANEAKAKREELMGKPADELIKLVDTANTLELFRQWAGDNALANEVEQDFDELAESATSSSPATSLESLLPAEEKTAEIEELKAKGKVLLAKLAEKDVDVPAIEQELIETANAIKNLGGSEEIHNRLIEKIRTAVTRAKSLHPVKKLFSDINTFSKLYFVKQEDRDALKEVLATVQEKDIIANTTVRITLNQFPKKEVFGNENFNVVSPEYNYEVIYTNPSGKEIKIGNLPEFNKFKLKDGRYLSEMVADPKVSEARLRVLTGIEDLSKAELEKIILAQQNLFDVAKSQIGSDKSKSMVVKTSDFNVKFHKGSYEYQSKNTIPPSTVDNMIANQPAGTEFVLVRIGKDNTGSPTMEGTVIKKGRKGKAAYLINEARNHVASVEGAEFKSIGSYVIYVKQPSGTGYLVAVKSPQLEIEAQEKLFFDIDAAASDIRALLSDTEKEPGTDLPLMTEPEKAEGIAAKINEKIRKSLFMAYPRAEMEVEINVHPKSGKVQLQFARLNRKGKGVLKSIRTISDDPTIPFQDRLIAAAKGMQSSPLAGEEVGFFIEGVANGKIFRQAYPQKTKFTEANLSGFIVSTSSDIVSGQNLSLVYNKKATKSAPPVKPPTANPKGASKDAYDNAIKMLTNFKSFLPEAYQGQNDIVALAKALVANKVPLNKKMSEVVTTIIEYNKPTNKSTISEEFNKVKEKLLSWRNNSDGLVVDPTNNENYVTRNTDGTIKKVFRRVTSLFNGKNQIKDIRFAHRGTVVDDLLRGFLEGLYATPEDFALAYNTHPNKSDTFEFMPAAVTDLWNIFQQVKQFADANNVELFTNLPPFWGSLVIDGKKIDSAGTVDVIAVNRNTGAITVIDLKTSTQNRRDTKDKNYSDYKAYDEFQQNGYAELISQRLGIEVSKLTILPLQTLMSNNKVTRIAQNAGEKGLLMGVNRLKDKFTGPENKTPPPPLTPPTLPSTDLWRSWKPGEEVTPDIYKSAVEFLNSSQMRPGMTVPERMALGKDRQRANEIISLFGGNNSGQPLVFKMGERSSRGQSLNTKKVRDQLKAILPQGVSVQFLDTFLDTFPEMGNAIGYYQDQVIYLLNSAEKGTQFHEAFHAVFRTAIPAEQRAIIIAEAKSRYGQAEPNALRAFGEVRNYRNLSPAELEDLWYEEKLADDFQNYMQGRENFFAKIWRNFIQWLGFIAGNRSTIDRVFRDISRGAFARGSVNSHTFSDTNLNTTPVFKLLTMGYQDIKGVPVMQKLNAEETENLINRVAHFAHREYSDNNLRNGRSMEEIVYSIIDDFASLYDEMGYYTRFENESPEFFDDREASGVMDRMRRFHTALTNPEAQLEILDAVKYKSSLMSFKEQLENDEYENFEDEVGSRFIKQDTASIGGFGSLSKWIREYIGFTSIEESDEFGNTEFRQGVPMVKTLDVNKVYNGILRATANQVNDSGFVERLKVFRNSNPESAIFINQFFNDVGLDESTNLPTKNFRLFQGVVKQMSMFKIDYSFVVLDADKTTPESFKVTNANLHDVDVVQVEQWNNNFMALSQTRKREFGDNMLEAAHLLKSINSATTLEELNAIAEDFHQAMVQDNVIRLSKGYTKFVIYSSLEEGSILSGNPEVKKVVASFEDVEALTVEDLNKIENEISQSRSPFAYTTIYKQESIEGTEDNGVDQDYEDDEDISATESTGAVTRARRIARANSIFDETVGSTSYQNAEGETVYAHQLPTYHLVSVNALKQGGELEQKAKNPFLAHNRILRREVWRNAFILGKLFRLDGIRSVSTDKSGKQNAFRDQKSGVTFRNMSPREFLLSQIIMAYKRRNKKGVIVKNENGNNVEVQMQPVLIRVLETSSTADFVEMPAMRDTYDSEGKLVKKAVMKEFMLRLQAEYSRISRVSKEIEAFKKFGIIPEGGLIENYHTGGVGIGTDSDLILVTKISSESEFRGLKFDKMRGMLTDEVLTSLTASAIQGIPLEEVMKDQMILKKVSDSINSSAVNEFNSFVDILIEEGILRKDSDKLENIQLPSDLEEKLIENLADIFFSDWVNTIAINELLIGDEALGLKNSVDAVKRAKGSNAAGPSIAHSGTNTLPAFTELPLAVFREPLRTVNLEGRQASKTKVADAQGYMTVKALRHVLHGLGKLTPDAEKMLDVIERGDAIGPEQIFGDKSTPGSVKSGHQLNSMKLVYYDGQRYIKLSVVPLSKQLTSYYHNGVWKAKPGFETLHGMREEMESATHPDPNMKGVAMAVPESGSKMVSADIKTLGEEPLVFHNLSTNFWRLQLENPSNKTSITDPSQILQLIDSELNNAEKVEFQGNETTIGEVASQFRSDAAQVRNNDFEQLAKSVVTPTEATDELKKAIRAGNITPKLRDFLKTAVATLSASGAEARLIEFFSPNDVGDFSFNLNMPATLNKFSELFVSYFSKNALRQKLPGYAVALMSGFGVEVMEEVGTGRIIQSEEFIANPEQFEADSNSPTPNKTLYRTRKLAHGVKHGNTIVSEFMLPAHFAEFLGLNPSEPIPDEISLMFGIRIPTQDKHSAINLRLVGFLPSFMGSTAIFPDELVALSGADFDIDKLYIHRPSHYMEDGKIKRFGSATTRDEKWKEFKIWKLTHDKTFKRKFLDLYNQAMEKHPDTSLAVQDIVTEIEELQKQMLGLEAELDDTSIINKVLNSALEMSEGDWNHYQTLSAKYGGDISSARTEIFSRRAETKELLREFREFLKVEIFNQTLREFSLPTSPEKLEVAVAERGELNNGVLYNRMLDAKMTMYGSEGAKAARQSPANLDAFYKLNNDPTLEGLFEDDFSYQVDNLKGKYTANKTGREGANNIGFAVNATIAFNILAKIGAKIMIKLPGINNRRGSKGFIPSKLSYVNRDGDRINDLLSNVTTAMTDNAKELIAAKYGISKEAIPVFTFMVALGYTFKEATLVINQPLVKLYLENKRRKSSSVITKEEDSMYINDFGGAKTLAENLGIEFQNDEESDREDISIKELVTDIKNYRSKKPLSLYSQKTAFILFQTLEEASDSFSHLNRLVKLVKGIDSDFESIDKVLEAHKNWFSDSNPFSEYAPQVFSSNELVARNFDLITMLDVISSKIFIERTSRFKTMMGKLIGQLKNPQFVKDAVKKEIKLNLLSYNILAAYKAIVNKHAKPEDWRRRSMSNFLVFDKTVEVLKEDYKQKNPDVTQTELDNMFPSITKLYRAAVNEVNEYNSQNNRRVRNAFLDYIVSKEATPTRNFHSLEAKTRVKENPLYSEKIRNGFEELMEGKYGEATRRFAEASIRYLMVKDGFQFKNSSFINLIPSKYLVAIGSTSFPGGSATDRVSKSFKDGTFEAQLGTEQEQLFDRFSKLFAIHPDNQFKLFFLRKGKSTGFNQAKSKEVSVTLTDDTGASFVESKKWVNEYEDASGKGFIEFNSKNQPKDYVFSESEKDYRMTIGSILEIPYRIFENKSGIYYDYRRFFRSGDPKDKGFVYILTHTMSDGGKWKKVDPKYQTDSGGFTSLGARYQKVPLQGMKGVSNIFDVDAGAPTFGQPMTIELQKNYGKTSKFDSRMPWEINQDLDVVIWNSGVEQASTTDLSSLTTSTNLPYYEGNITPSPDTIFVFGSNPEGRHGAGAAKVAKDKFGAIYGQGKGLQGNAYAIPTKDLRVTENQGFRSISAPMITVSIMDMYEVARKNPDKKFKVAYRNTTDKSLSGYTGIELIEMFNAAAGSKGIPSNVIFSKEWVDTGLISTPNSIQNVPDPTTSDPSLPPSGNKGGSNAKAFIRKFAFTLGLDQNLLDSIRGFDSNVPKESGGAALKYIAEKYLADAPDSLLNADPQGVVAWILQNKFC